MMRCRKCDKVVKETFAASWDDYQICPECFDKSKFYPNQTLELSFLDTMKKGEIIRYKSTPIDFWLDMQTARVMRYNE